MSEIEPIATIAIRNPRVVEVAQREKQFGAGRTLVEVVTNLFLEKAEQRRIEREMNRSDRSDRSDHSVHASEHTDPRIAAKRRLGGRDHD